MTQEVRESFDLTGEGLALFDPEGKGFISRAGHPYQPDKVQVTLKAGWNPETELFDRWRWDARLVGTRIRRDGVPGSRREESPWLAVPEPFVRLALASNLNRRVEKLTVALADVAAAEALILASGYDVAPAHTEGGDNA